MTPSGERSWSSDDGRFIVRAVPRRADALSIAEVKGPAHPDTLADDLAERLSSAYAQHTRAHAGAVLHHNFDKVCLLGGASRVTFGAGEIVRPVRVLINGRASLSIGDRDLDVASLLRAAAVQFFAQRLPLLPRERLSIELNLSTSSSPGAVVSGDDRADGRAHWFAPRSLGDLRERTTLLANDTSLGTGFAPLEVAHRYALGALAAVVALGEPWLGGDIKIMALARDNRVDVTACVPQIARHVRSQAEYDENLRVVAERLEAQARSMQLEPAITLNARDRRSPTELYLTASGSSLESGDEGVVGRGNRVNGAITPTGPMNMEGFAGKNPVYHVGKLYNVAASLIATRLHWELGGRFTVHLISQTGTGLLEPWRVIVETEQKPIDRAPILEIVEAGLEAIPELTRRIIEGSAQAVVAEELGLMTREAELAGDREA